MRLFRVTTLQAVALPFGDTLARAHELTDEDNCRLSLEDGMVFARGPRIVVVPLSNVAFMEAVRSASISPLPEFDTQPGVPSAKRRR